MQENSSSGGLVAAALILGAAILGSAYLLATSIDRGSDQLASLNESLKTAAAAPKAAARPSGPNRPDPEKVYDIELGDAPIRGSKSAKVTIVEWADFQCPFCVRVNPTLERIAKEYGDKVRFAFKHLPLSMHAKARAAHAAVTSSDTRSEVRRRSCPIDSGLTRCSIMQASSSAVVSATPRISRKKIERTCRFDSVRSASWSPGGVSSTQP